MLDKILKDITRLSDICGTTYEKFDKDFYKKIDSEIYELIQKNVSLSDIYIIINPMENEGFKNDIKNVLLDFSIPLSNYIENYCCPDKKVIVTNKTFLGVGGRYYE